MTVQYCSRCLLLETLLQVYIAVKKLHELCKMQSARIVLIPQVLANHKHPAIRYVYYGIFSHIMHITVVLKSQLHA